jgi:hypothetical protein
MIPLSASTTVVNGLHAMCAAGTVEQSAAQITEFVTFLEAVWPPKFTQIYCASKSLAVPPFPWTGFWPAFSAA